MKKNKNFALNLSIGSESISAFIKQKYPLDDMLKMYKNYFSINEEET